MPYTPKILKSSIKLKVRYDIFCGLCHDEVPIHGSGRKATSKHGSGPIECLFAPYSSSLNQHNTLNISQYSSFLIL